MQRIFGYLKLLYLYMAYWLVGIDEEGYYIRKGNYLVDLEHYAAAAKSYSNALRETKSPYVYAALGHCYIELGLFDKAATQLQEAYSRRPRTDFGIGLARSLFESG